MLQTIPWKMIIAMLFSLVGLYYIGWEIFGPPKKARRVLVNGVSGIAFAWGTSLIGGLLGYTLHINLAMLTASFALGIPGAALIGVLQYIL